jgi:hypothetical protein
MGFYFRELRGPIHQFPHFRAEAVLQLIQRDTAVLHHVMEKGSGQGGSIKLEISQKEAHLDRVLQVWPPGKPDLTPMAQLREVVGLLKEALFFRGQVMAGLVQESL